jgi:FtsZ-interacting cell division protein YlmF
VEESPLIHIKEDVFRDVKRTLKRVATLTQEEQTAKERSRLVATSTVKKKVRGREHMQTMLARDENGAGTPLGRIKRESTKQFKINMLRKGKYSDSKSCDKLLRDRKVLQVYDNNFLQDVLATNDSTFAD